MPNDPLDGMRERIETCRRLAKRILDVKAAQALLEMAEEIELDLKKLEEARESPRGLASTDPASNETKPTIVIRPE